MRVEYSVKGMELQSGPDTYLAWGVQNTLRGDEFYYAKVESVARSSLFGVLPVGDEVELHL